jgi:hypothetical protein
MSATDGWTYPALEGPMIPQPGDSNAQGYVEAVPIPGNDQATQTDQPIGPEPARPAAPPDHFTDGM